MVVCRVCGFKAVATGVEIEEALTGNRRQPIPSRNDLMKIRQAEMAALPFWKKPIGYLLRGMQFVGSVIVVFGILDLSGMKVLLGIGVAFVAEVIFQLLRGRFPKSRMPG